MAEIGKIHDSQTRILVDQLFTRFESPSILDIGCGRLRLLNGLATHKKQVNWTYHGVDLEDPKKKFKDEFEQMKLSGLAKARWSVGTIEKLRTSHAKFDIAVVMNVLHEASITGLAEILEEARNHLTDEGDLFLIDTPRVDAGEPEFVPYFSWEIERIFKKYQKLSYLSKSGIPIQFYIVGIRNIPSFHELPEDLFRLMVDKRDRLTEMTSRERGMKDDSVKKDWALGTSEFDFAYLTVIVRNAHQRLLNYTRQMNSLDRRGPELTSGAYDLFRLSLRRPEQRKPMVSANELYETLGPKHSYTLVGKLLEVLEKRSVIAPIESPEKAIIPTEIWHALMSYVGVDSIRSHGLDQAISLATQEVTKRHPSKLRVKDRPEPRVTYLKTSMKSIPKASRTAFFESLVKTGTRHGRAIIPFVPFDAIEQTLKSRENLFIVGLKGAGKSRVLYEALSRNIYDSDTLVVVGSRESINNISVPQYQVEIGDSSIKNIVEIAQRESRDGSTVTIVWNDFPDGLTPNSESLETNRRVLQELATQGFARAMIALYPEQYSQVSSLVKGISRVKLTTIRVRYSFGEFKRLVEVFGRVYLGESGYRSRVKQEQDLITARLFNRGKLPLTVKLYYDQLSRSKETNPVGLAQNISNLTVIQHAKRQLQSIGLSLIESSRVNDFHLLYTLKLADFVGENNNRESIYALQERIFHTIPISPRQTVGDFFDAVDNRYFLPDIFKDALILDEDAMDSVLAFLGPAGITGLIRRMIQRGVSFYGFTRLADFLMENVSEFDVEMFLKNLESYLPLPDVSHEEYPPLGGLFFGLGKHIDNLSLDKMSHLRALISKDGRSQDLLALGTAPRFRELGDDSFEQILLLTERHDRFADGLGYGLGDSLELVRSDIKRLSQLLKANAWFGEGLAFILSQIARDFSEEQRYVVNALLRRDESFRERFPTLFSAFFMGMTEGDTKWIRALLQIRVGDFRFRLGRCGGMVIMQYLTHAFTMRQEPSTQDVERILKIATYDGEFADGVGYLIGEELDGLDEEELRTVEECLAEVFPNYPNIAEGCGAGFAYGSPIYHSHLPRSEPSAELKALLTRLSENRKFVKGLKRVWDIRHPTENWKLDLISIDSRAASG